MKTYILGALLGLLIVFGITSALGNTIRIIYQPKAAPYAAGCSKQATGTRCEITLSSDILSTGHYSPILQFLVTAKKGDTVVFYLAGNGGSGSTVIAFQQAIENTKATVKMVVIGPVYSAHAMLALLGHKLEVRSKYALFMIHHASGYRSANDLCESSLGQKDRGRDAYQKCLSSVKVLMTMYTRVIRDITFKYLSRQERVRVDNGEDVYIHGKVIEKRFNKAN